MCPAGRKTERELGEGCNKCVVSSRGSTPSNEITAQSQAASADNGNGACLMESYQRPWQMAPLPSLLLGRKDEESLDQE